MNGQHDFLILGSPRSGTTRLHKLLVQHYAVQYDKKLPKYEIFNHNYYKNMGDTQARLDAILNGDSFQVIKCLFEQFKTISDSGVSHFIDAYSNIILCIREDLSEQCLSYAIAHNLHVQGKKRWNVVITERSFEVLPDSLMITELDISRFFDHYVHSFRIQKLLPQEKVKILKYQESCQLAAPELLQYVGVNDSKARDVTIKLDSFNTKFEYIKNKEQVQAWIAQHIERINNDFKL